MNNQDNFAEHEAYERARCRVKKVRGFFSHLISYIIVNAFLIGIIAINKDNHEFWSFGTFSTAFFWGIGLFFHAFGVFGRDYLFSKTWEDRKIREYMKEDRQKWQ